MIVRKEMYSALAAARIYVLTHHSNACSPESRRAERQHMHACARSK